MNWPDETEIKIPSACIHQMPEGIFTLEFQIMSLLQTYMYFSKQKRA